MKKATHTGECQICGNTQALPSGLLSKHGYTVNWGFFHGVCSGHGKQPFELSCDDIALVVEQVRAQLAKTQAERHELLTGPVSYWVREITTRSWVRFSDLVAANAHTETKTNRHGNEVLISSNKPSSVAQYVQYAIDTLIVDMENYIEWQTERMANWAPKALTPIDGRDILHFQRSRPVLVDGSIKMRVLSSKSACNRVFGGWNAKQYRELSAAGNYKVCTTCHAAFEEYEAMKEKIKADFQSN
jgi:hypothetical protein